MKNAHVAGENVELGGTEGPDDALARKEIHFHRFTHCQYGDPYGTTPGGIDDHWVTMDQVGKITETTTKKTSAKWAVATLNAARASLPEHLR